MFSAARIAPRVNLEELAAKHFTNKFIDRPLVDQRDPAPRHRLDLQRIVSAGTNIGEHQTGYSLRVIGGESQCRPPAQRKADDGRTLDFERVKNADQIAREKSGRITGGIGGGAGLAVT